LPRASGLCPWDFTMSHNVGGGYPIIVPEYREQECKRLHLVWCWLLVVEISDQRYSNRHVVHASGFTVGATLLTNPTRGHFDLAVAFSKGPVINQEMIPETIPKTALPVRPVNSFGVPFSRGRMMHNDVFPPRVPVKVYNVSNHSGVRDNQFLTNLQRVAGFESVGRIDGFWSDAIHPGDPPYRFEWPELMVNCPGLAQIAYTFFNHFGRSAGSGNLPRVRLGRCLSGRGPALIGVRIRGARRTCARVRSRIGRGDHFFFAAGCEGCKKNKEQKHLREDTLAQI